MYVVCLSMESMTLLQTILEASRAAPLNERFCFVEMGKIWSYYNLNYSSDNELHCKYNTLCKLVFKTFM